MNFSSTSIDCVAGDGDQGLVAFNRAGEGCRLDRLLPINRRDRVHPAFAGCCDEGAGQAVLLFRHGKRSRGELSPARRELCPMSPPAATVSTPHSRGAAMKAQGKPYYFFGMGNARAESFHRPDENFVQCLPHPWIQAQLLQPIRHVYIWTEYRAPEVGSKPLYYFQRCSFVRQHNQTLFCQDKLPHLKMLGDSDNSAPEAQTNSEASTLKSCALTPSGMTPPIFIRFIFRLPTGILIIRPRSRPWRSRSARKPRAVIFNAHSAEPVPILHANALPWARLRGGCPRDARLSDRRRSR